MKKLLELGNAYAKRSDWMDFALVKFCLCSIGLFIGSCLPVKRRKEARIAAVAVFITTYIPLMMKMYETYVDMKEKE